MPYRIPRGKAPNACSAHARRPAVYDVTDVRYSKMRKLLPDFFPQINAHKYNNTAAKSGSGTSARFVQNDASNDHSACAECRASPQTKRWVAQARQQQTKQAKPVIDTRKDGKWIASSAKELIKIAGNVDAYSARERPVAVTRARKAGNRPVRYTLPSIRREQQRQAQVEKTPELCERGSRKWIAAIALELIKRTGDVDAHTARERPVVTRTQLKRARQMKWLLPLSVASRVHCRVAHG